MADTNINDNRGGGSATTVLVSVIIVILLAAAFWFGYGRSHWGNGAPADDGAGINIDVSGTFPAGSGQDGGPAE